MMAHLGAALYALNALVCLAMGVRYFRRADFLPYQARAVGRNLAGLDPALQIVILAMLKAIGGLLVGFGVVSLGLCAELWRGSPFANGALLLGSAFILGALWLAADSVNRLGPGMGAPTRLVAVSAGIAALAFVAVLAG